MNNWNTILFDFDGTLINTEPGITHGILYALEQMNATRGEIIPFHAYIGPPLMDFFQQYCGMTEEKATLGVKIYREYYGEHGILECEPYPGIPALLHRLKQLGKTVCIATSKPRHFAEAILRRYDWYDCFDVVSGAGRDGSNGGKAEVIRQALAECAAPLPAVMVGDRLHDIAGAKCMGLPCIAVLYGFGGREEFETAGAEFIVRDTVELEALLCP